MADRAVAEDDRAEPRAQRSRRSAGRRRLSVDERRDELIRTALELFGRRSPDDVSIDDVASAAGASRALVYHYFGGKQELYLAALRSAERQLSVLLEPPAEGGPVQRLRTSLHRYFDFVESHATGFSALLRGGPTAASGEVGELVQGIRKMLLEKILQSLQVEGPGPVLQITLRSWMASVETAGMDWLELRQLSRPVLEDLLVDQFVVLLRSAGRHDPDVAELYERLTAEESAD